MKPKLVAILVIGVLSLSIVATGGAASSQAVAEESGGSTNAFGGFSSQIGETDDDNKAVSAFKLVCPFH